MHRGFHAAYEYFYIGETRVEIKQGMEILPKYEKDLEFALFEALKLVP